MSNSKYTIMNYFKNKFKLVTLLVLIMAMSNTGLAQKCGVKRPMNISTLLGEWKGNFSSEGTILPFTVIFSQDQSAITASVEGMGEKAMVLPIKKCKTHVHLTTFKNGLSYSFKIEPSSRSISGSIKVSKDSKALRTEIYVLSKEQKNHEFIGG